MRVAFALVIAVALAAPARAEAKTLKSDDRAIGLVVQGNGALRDKIEAHLDARLRRDGYTPNTAPLNKDALNTIANCFIIEDLECARGVFEARARTPRLVFARIDDSTGTVTLDVTWFSLGHAPVSAKAECADCTASWRERTDELFGTLTEQAEMPILPLDRDLEAPAPPRSRFWPTTLIAAGAATLVTGSVLLYYGLRDGPTHKYVYPSLTPVGISLIAVGGGAMIGGIITW